MSYSKSEADSNFVINLLSIFSESESESESYFHSVFTNLGIFIFFIYIYTLLNKLKRMIVLLIFITES